LPAPRRREIGDLLDLEPSEPDAWEAIAGKLSLPLLEQGIIGQFARFEQLHPLNPAVFGPEPSDERIDWLLEERGDTVGAYQVTKQADVLMLLYLLRPGGVLAEVLGRMGYPASDALFRRTAEYYLRRITHESSLSRVVCAGALAHLDSAASWRFFQDAMMV